MKLRILALFSNVITKAFHFLYYGLGKRTWMSTYWMGTPLLKCPLDLWIYQEIMYEIKPDVVIETGTHQGGSARFLAYLLDVIGNGKIVTVDIKAPETTPPHHDRIQYILGSSIAEETIQKVKNQINPGEKVMVILDSNHHRDHVLEELKIYGELVSPGSYMIVEDSNVGGHPVYKKYGPGPMEAIQSFMKSPKGTKFMIDRSKEKFYMTFNPSGYLKKVS